MKQKIALYLLALFLFFASGTVFTAFYVKNTTGELGRLIELHQIKDFRQNLVGHIQDAQTDLYTIRTPLAHELDSIVSDVIELQHAAHACHTCHHVAQVSSRIEELESLIQDYQRGLSYYITASGKVQRMDLLKLQAARAGNELLVKSEEMSYQASRKLELLSTATVQKIHQARKILYSTVSLTFLLSILIAFHLTRSITRPVKKLLEATRSISKGYLGYSVDYKDKTELGELASNFNTMSMGLKEGYTKLQEEIQRREQTEEELRSAIVNTKEEKAKSEAIIAALGEGISIQDTDYKILYQNEVHKDTIGDHVGECCYEAYQKRERICEECPLALSFKDGGIHTRERSGETDNGKIYVEITTSPLRNENGKIIAGIELVRNITEQKKLQEQLRHSQKMEAIGILTGGVAHDFNNILTAITGYGDLMQEKIHKDDPLRPYLDTILLSADRATKLVKSLLAYSRKQTVNLQPINLNDIIRRGERLLSRLIGEDIEMKTIEKEKDLLILADSALIEQVLMNLVTNARDAMPGGGLLIIETSRVELDEKFVHTHGDGTPGAYAIMAITDSGKGMDETTKEKIFDPFFTTKEIGRGTGLGLSTAYGIVKQHNGFIDVYSEPDKGTTFKIYLPVITSAVMAVEKVEIPSVQGGTETLLVAEDDESVRSLISSVLERFGYTVIVTKNGKEAVDRFLENRENIQLLLFDLIMPQKTGKDAYTEIKKISPEIKVLFLSGYSEDLMYRKGILEEGLDFITKPVLLNDLLREVRRVLDKETEESIC